jgi:type IV pilus assembly protein PilA
LTTWKGHIMKRISNSLAREERGFTLIELLIIIVILSILATAIIPNVGKFIHNGEVGVANAELAAIRTSIGAYQSQNNQQYPCDTQPNEDANQPINNSLVSPDYITGTVKGEYLIDSDGNIIDADNGTWPATIYFNKSTLKWERSK